MIYTIDTLIRTLLEARDKAKLGGGTVVHVCLDDEPYAPVMRVEVENDDDGAVVLLFPAREVEKEIDGWRDMKSAPKDGSLILLSEDEKSPVVAKWDGQWSVDWDGNRYWVSDETSLRWRPLP